MDGMGILTESLDRLSAAAALLERTVASLEERHSVISGEVQRVVAAVESEPSRREADLERKLRAAEQQIAELRAGSEPGVRGAAVRKTLPATAAHMLAKQGITTFDQIEAGALDAALTGLSLEQRIAVKSQLMRAGALV